MIDGWKEERPSKNRNIFCKHKGTLCLRGCNIYLPLFCIVNNIKILASNTTWPEWKARLFHRNCLRSGQQQQQVDIQSWWQRHANIWSRIVQWLYHAPLTTTHKYFTRGRSLSTALAQFSLFNCYNKLRGTIHLLSSGQSVKCGFSLPAETGRPVSSSSLGSCQPCPLCDVWWRYVWCVEGMMLYLTEADRNC